MNGRDIILICGLALLAFFDIKHKMIPVVPVIVIGASLLAGALLDGEPVLKLVTGLIPGGILLLLAVCTSESIGIGDGLVFCMIGAGCGFTRTITVLGLALVISAVISMVLLCKGKVEKKTELPFLPSVFLGFCLELIW